MEENLKWLWYAFSAGWILHLTYVVSISIRQKRLGRQMQDLKSLLEEHESRKNTSA
jgi:hypothetical protein